MNTSIGHEIGRIGVMMGGTSSEREISLKSGKAVSAALKEAGCDVCPLDLSLQDKESILHVLEENRIDLVFIALHGHFGEDGTLQEILDEAGIPYTGSGAEASRLAMHKDLAQPFLKAQGLRVPEFQIISKEEKEQDVALHGKMSFPLVVKPAAEGSSLGITIAQNRDEFQQALKTASRYGGTILLEEFIPGREITAGILGDEALPLVEIRPSQPFFDFTAKYQKGMTDYIVPAQIPKEKTALIQATAREAFRLLGCRDFGRIDFIMTSQGEVVFLEANTIPGFTETSLLPMAAREKGYSFPDLCRRIALSAGQRKQT